MKNFNINDKIKIQCKKCGSLNATVVSIRKMQHTPYHILSIKDSNGRSGIVYSNNCIKLK